MIPNGKRKKGARRDTNPRCLCGGELIRTRGVDGHIRTTCTLCGRVVRER